MSKNKNKLSSADSRRTLRRIAELLGAYKLDFVLSFLCAGVAVFGQLYIPILTGRSFDLMKSGGFVDFSGIDVIIIKIAVCSVAAAAAQWGLGYINNRIAFRAAGELRAQGMRKISSLPLSYLDSHPVGDMLSRLTADADLFGDGLLMAFTQLIPGVFTICGTVIFMLSVNVPIALTVICVTPLSLAAAAFIAKKSFRYINAQNSVRGEETALINERIYGLKEVWDYAAEERDLKDLDCVNDKLRDVSLKAVFFSSITNPATRFVNGIVYACVGLAGSLSVISGGLTIGGFSIFLAYANQYTKPFNEISGVVTEMQNSISCAARIFELLDAPSMVPDAPDAAVISPDEVRGDAALRSVCFGYTPGRELIHDLDLTVRPGEHVAIVGPTGCGKTTLINLLMRFYDVDSGSISVSGTDIRDMKRSSLRSCYGMVLQETWLMTGTVAENIAYGRPDATREEVTAAAAAAHADAFIARMPQGYDTVLGSGGDELSEGQKQLLCIARVMLTRPPMLILDEATSSIDTRTELLIQRAFDEMMEGRTSFVVAHRLSTIRNADMILVMKDGSIIESGTHDELIKAGGFYAGLCASQFAGQSI